MARGRLIVASDLLSIGEVLDDGANALLVGRGDAKALGAAITKPLGARARSALWRGLSRT